MTRCLIMAASLLALAALPALATPIDYPECPAVGLDTTGCALLITITAAGFKPHTPVYATAFTVTASGGPTSYDGGDGTLIGVLNDFSAAVNDVWFTVAPGTGTFHFDLHGACLGTGSPLVSAYSPGPTAADCLNGAYRTADAFDYASASVTFLSFNLADAGIIVGEPAGALAPGASSWFSLPGDITAGEITVAAPPTVTPEPISVWLLGIGIVGLGFFRQKSEGHSRI